MFARLVPSGLAMAALAGLAAPAPAQVFVRAPFVNVQVGRSGVFVQAPFVSVRVARPYAVPVPAPVLLRAGPSVVLPPAPRPYLQPASTSQYPVRPAQQPAAIGSQPEVNPPGYIPPNIIPPSSSLYQPPEDNPPGYIPPTLNMPAPEGPPAAAATPAVARRATSLPEFAHNFDPTPGQHQALLIHPATRQTVPVSFTLPQARVRQVLLGANEVCFNYGQQQVWIRFLRDGQVRVSN